MRQDEWSANVCYLGDGFWYRRYAELSLKSVIAGHICNWDQQWVFILQGHLKDHVKKKKKKKMMSLEPSPTSQSAKGLCGWKVEETCWMALGLQYLAGYEFWRWYLSTNSKKKEKDLFISPEMFFHGLRTIVELSNLGELGLPRKTPVSFFLLLWLLPLFF